MTIQVLCMKPEDFVCLPRLVRDYLNYLSSVKGKSQLTVCEYASDLRLFFAYMLKQENLSQYKNTPIDEIDISKLDIDFISLARIPTAYGFLEYCRAERGNDTAARARKVVSIKRFYRYLKVQGYIDENPMQDLESPKIKKSLPKYLSLEQAVSLLESVDGKNKERDYCILCIFLNCGLRISELVGLNLQDDHGDSLRILGKGSKERVVYLNDACREALDRYLAVRSEIAPPRTTAMFLSNRRTRISCDSVQVMVKKNLTRAGLDASQYSTHKLRHTAATLMLQNGVDVRTLQEVLGHEHLNTTQIYTHVDNDQLRTAAAANPLGEFSPDEKTAKKISDS